jgi:glycopeptide antibiotics resistance protein
MPKRLLLGLILIAYGALVVRLVVFKTMLIRIGHMRFRFGPEGGESNLVPFKTILAYAVGEPGGAMATLNLVGNVILFTPIGILVPLVFPNTTWPKVLAVAAGVGLTVEAMELAFRVGIFDVDDILLNGLGVMIGYWAFMKQRRAPAGRS